MLWLILSLVVILTFTVWATWTAGRIDRLGARCDAAWQSLDAALVRRGAALQDVLAEHGGEPASAQAAVRSAFDAPRDDRADAENVVSSQIAALPAAAITDTLAESCIQVQTARTFYNDAVRAANALRAQRLPRLLRLGRSSVVPPFFDISDDPGLGPAAGASPAR